MLAGIKKYGKLLLMSFLVLTGATFFTTKVEALDDTNRNEQFPADEYTIPVSGVSSADEYLKIYENKNFEYFYQSRRNILKIRNKQTGFIWSTGAGNTRKNEMESKCSHVKANTDEYFACTIDAGPNRNGNDNEAAYAEINQLLGFTYINRTSTATQTKSNVEIQGDVEYAQLVRHKTYANRWMFKVSYKTSIDKETKVININMRFLFDDKGFNVDILKEDISGSGSYALEAIYPLPCFGQSGGNMLTCTLENVDSEGYGSCKFEASSITKNPKTDLPGYVFVPDGSGALIRFDTDREMNNDEVYFDIYGDPYRSRYTDVEFNQSEQVYEPDYVMPKKVMMPVWGVSYGNEQDAFVAYATSGSEYFGLVFKGRSEKQSKFAYTQTKPRFERNRKYKYSFGSSSGTILYLNEKELFNYDMGLRYDILYGDGTLDSLPANYVGMALSYRDYLVKSNLVRQDVELNTGVKVDFLISDVKRSIVGYEDVIATKTNSIEEILKDLKTNNIDYVTSSLIGWQNNGVAMAHPGKADYNSQAGGKSGFKSLVTKANEYGYDVSFQQDYGLINSDQMPNIGGYSVKALNRNYGAYILNDTNKPVRWWHYSNPNMAMTWLNNQVAEVSKLGDNVGITMNGISNILAPDYGKGINYEQSKKIIVNGTKKASTKVKLGADSANAYLWANLDNIYDIPTYNSQFIVETDSVPFLEIVLGGLINLYANYSNFSFFDEQARLKLIEYNLNPSFIITEKSNEDIMYTNSRDYYSTGYGKYKDTIVDLCADVLPILKLLQGKTIVDREVVSLNNNYNDLGLYVNTYAPFVDGKIVEDQKVVIAINYFDHAVTYNGQEIAPLSAKVM